MKIDSTISKEEIFTRILPDIPTELDSNEVEEMMNDIGEYIFSEIFDYLAEGKSPVTGEKFQELSKSYADAQKNGDVTPNLDLNGDMLRSMQLKVEADGITVGIFDKDQAKKAYNHNQGDTLPQRQFIPDKGEAFAADIMEGIIEIIDLYKEQAGERQDSEEA